MEFLQNEQVGKVLLCIIACYVVFVSPFMAWTAWKENRRDERSRKNNGNKMNNSR